MRFAEICSCGGGAPKLQTRLRQTTAGASKRRDMVQSTVENQNGRA